MRAYFACCMLICSGCASPVGRPYAIVHGGMRMPTNEACRISDDGTRLLPCTVEGLK